jgi:NACHT domain
VIEAKAWEPFTAVLVSLGIPAAAAAEWRHLVVRYPIAALALAAGWLAICGVGFLARRAVSGPVQRRLEQVGNAMDQRVGWWVSGYGRRYRLWVLDSRRYIDVKDLATGGDHTPQLDDVYVDVALVRRAPHQISGNPLGGVPVDAAGRHSVSEFLDRRGQVVLAVVGPPGSGKSTLLAHAACRSAQGAGPRNRRRVPVLLALREFAGTIAESPQASLPDVLRPAISGVPGNEPDGWWDRQLRRGKCMLLLDGLDEVAREEDRRAVTNWVERQISSYPGNQFVITSRPYGFPGPLIAQADVLAVRPFSDAQVQLFLDRWYLATEQHATGAVGRAQMQSVRIRASESAARLLALLRDNPPLRDLTANPLLLTMIATVHRYRGALPGSRADLYAEICQVMLSRRLQAKDLPELLPWPSKRKVLAGLAFHMMVERISELPVSQFQDILGALMRRLPQTVTAQAFLDDISRNGLLVEPAAGRYAFTHRTFQEYFAAQHISGSTRLAKTLVGSVDDPWWRETTLLYAATADVDPIVRACLDSATIPALSLAFDCADIASELSPELRQRLDQARDQAYEQNCDPQYRRLIASVLAARLARRTVNARAGTRICDRPVPADLYWLFLCDSRSPHPDRPCEPRPDQPATGIWGDEAFTFLKWLNAITASSTRAEFRLPHEEELHEAVDSAVGRELPDSVTSAWTQPQHGSTTPGLWVRPGCPDPHLVTYDAIRTAILLDSRETDILLQIYTLAAFNAAQDLARAPSNALAISVAVALDRVRELSTARVSALDRAHADAGESARVRERNRAAATGRAVELGRARDIDRDDNLTRARGTDRALRRAIERKFDLDIKLANNDITAKADARYMAQALAGALDRDSNGHVRFLGVSDIPSTWFSNGPLGRIARKVIAAGRLREKGEIFAEELALNAGLAETTPIRASLDGSLMETLRSVKSANQPSDLTGSGWDTAAGAHSLAEAAAPILDAHHYPGPDEAAGIRAVALALASDSMVSQESTVKVFRALAATVTLLQQRKRNTAPAGECVILAVE